jgi:cilia- and flagella-associated protein 52
MIYPIGGLLVLEDTNDKHNQEFLRGHDMEISCIAVSASGKMFATGQKGTIFQKIPESPVILWNGETKQPAAVLKGFQQNVTRLAFSPDERFLAGIGANNSFIIWDTRDGAPIHTRITD